VQISPLPHPSELQAGYGLHDAPSGGSKMHGSDGTSGSVVSPVSATTLLSKTIVSVEFVAEFVEQPSGIMNTINTSLFMNFRSFVPTNYANPGNLCRRSYPVGL